MSLSSAVLRKICVNEQHSLMSLLKEIVIILVFVAFLSTICYLDVLCHPERAKDFGFDIDASDIHFSVCVGCLKATAVLPLRVLADFSVWLTTSRGVRLKDFVLNLMAIYVASAFLFLAGVYCWLVYLELPELNYFQAVQLLGEVVKFIFVVLLLTFVTIFAIEFSFRGAMLGIFIGVLAFGGVRGRGRA